MINQRDCVPGEHFSKGFADTNTFATSEWAEAQRVTRLAIWSLEILGIRVKAIGNKLAGLMPFIWMMMDKVDED